VQPATPDRAEAAQPATPDHAEAAQPATPDHAELEQPASPERAEGTPPAKELAAIVPAANNPEPPAVAASNEEPTGSITTGALPAAVPSVRQDTEIEGLDDGS
jgi:hypothetical protein